ncbi:MAG: transketolase [Spirochaetales bacterium]|nr:transketolase [Spirochaetales bacterium]
MNADIPQLKRIACKLRISVIDMIREAGSGHPGGSLSIADIMAVLYFHAMRINPVNPDWPDRDRFILSKGHAAPILYAALAERGFFPAAALGTLRKKGSILQGHPDMTKTPGVDISTGCLGEGLSAGIGVAISAGIDGRDFNTFVIIGDGEVQEGQVWEAAMYAGSKKLSNLIAIVDDNGCMCDDHIDDILPMPAMGDKWQSFGWKVIEVDGHNIADLIRAIDQSKTFTGGPVLIQAKCIKGKGVSFMENQPNWHGQVMKEDEYQKAIAELKGA